jgi:DUF438 domain-containing protein
MKITAVTKVHDLLDAYPFLKDWLATYSPDFEKLKNPVIYNTVGRFADLKTAAAMADKEIDPFLDDIRTAIAQHTIVAEESAPEGAHQLDEAEAARRQATLKALIHKLHDGASVDDVKAEFDSLVTGIDSAEIARMEQALIAEGMPVEEVMRLCDVHVTVFKEALEDKPDAAVEAGHPVDAYQRENVVLGEMTSELRQILEALEAGDDGALIRVGEALEKLAQVDVHYTRKENQLFPVLENHEVEGPTKVMWGLDDDIRGRIKTARALAAAGDTAALILTLPETLTMVDDMIYKEEKILFPTALQVITEAEWTSIADGDAEIGYAWIEGPAGAAGRAAAVAATPRDTDDAGAMLLPLVTGALSVEQLNLMFRVLPFDVSYVDENDRVRFYSEGERVFPRSPGAIGREVRNCHPPSSVDKVEQILSEFKAGTKDIAEFWIQMGPKFIHIRYFAMRDGAGAYRGCLEVVQDATHVRSLAGQRRIVEW